jgi:hypothetical protein
VEKQDHPITCHDFFYKIKDGNNMVVYSHVPDMNIYGEG